MQGLVESVRQWVMSEHPNVSLVRKVGEAVQAREIAAAADVLSDDVVWHYFNLRLPDLIGDQDGLEGIQAFLGRIAARTGGTFATVPVSVHPAGDELVVAHIRPTLTLDGQDLKTDAVVVWSIRGHRIVEVWDIPAVHRSTPEVPHKRAGPAINCRPDRVGWMSAVAESERTWRCPQPQSQPPNIRFGISVK